MFAYILKRGFTRQVMHPIIKLFGRMVIASIKRRPSTYEVLFVGHVGAQHRINPLKMADCFQVALVTDQFC